MTVALPTKKQSRNQGGLTPLAATVLLAGTPGVGKTTLYSRWAPDTSLHIDTQHGTDFLDGEHYVAHITTWREFVGLVDQLTQPGAEHPFKTVGVDVIGDLWTFCDVHHAGKDSPSASATDDYQRSIKRARQEFKHQIGRLLDAPMGLWMLAHVREKKDGDKTLYGVEVEDAQILNYLKGVAPFVFLAERFGPRRKLHTQPSAKFEAKTRVPLPDELPLDARAIYDAMAAGLNGVTPSSMETN